MNKQVIDSLYRIGASVFNGAFSTFLAVVAMANSQTYIFRVFFRQFFLVTLIGSVHGLIVLPVLLSWFGPNSSVIKPDELNHQKSKDENTNKNKDKNNDGITTTETENTTSDNDNANGWPHAIEMNPISEEEEQGLKVRGDSKHRNQSTLPSMNVEDVVQAFNQEK